MGSKSKIEWTEASWNMISGCTKISSGCKNCYAERMATRFGRDFSKVVCDESKLDQPTHWKRPRKIFVCSTADLFHADVPFSFISKVFDIMEANPRHTFQILTKRADRMAEWFELRSAIHDYNNGPEVMLPNVWVGVTTENQEMADLRIPFLFRCPAEIRFVSVEPMIGSVDLNRFMSGEMGNKLDWVIIGGESGQNARPCHPMWVRNLVNNCRLFNTPIMFKQWGEWGPAEELSDESRSEWVNSEKETKSLLMMSDGSFKETSFGVRVPFEPAWATPGMALMLKLGKHKTGRFIDDYEYLEYPK
jgi:protein gp37